MKIEKQEIPENMKNSIKEVSKVDMPKLPPLKEKDTISILKEIREDEDKNIKSNKRATFMVNLVFLMSLVLFVYMIVSGLGQYAIPALGLTIIGAFIFNLFIFSESKRTKKRQTAIDSFYMTYQYNQTH